MKMPKHSSATIPFLAGSALIFASASASAAPLGVYFEDNFDNRDNWFTGEASSTLTASGGALIQTLDANSTFFAYLTESGLISLDPGQSIILRFDVSYQNLTGNGPGIRFGLFDHSGVASGRITEDGLGQSGTQFNGTQGIAVWNDGQAVGSTTSIRRRTTAASNTFLNGTSPWAQTTLESGGNTVPHGEAVVSDRIYTTEFSVTRLMDDNVTMAASLWYVDGENTIVLYDAETVPGSGGGRVTEFDMAAFRVTNLADSISLHSLTVEVIPEPSTYALMTGTLLMAVVYFRRRRRS